MTRSSPIKALTLLSGSLLLAAGLSFGAPLLMSEAAPDQFAALAAPGGNGNGNGKGAENGNGGAAAAGRGSETTGSSSNNGLAKGKTKEGGQVVGSSNSNKDLSEAAKDARDAIHDSIKGLADVLGGRLNALHSAINGNTSNAASHSAAGQASVAYGAVTSEEGTPEENSETLGQSLGNLSTQKEPVEDTSPLEDAITGFADAVAGAFQESDVDEVEEGEESEAIDAELAADTANETIESRDGQIGMSAAKEDDGEDEGEDEL